MAAGAKRLLYYIAKQAREKVFHLFCNNFNSPGFLMQRIPFPRLPKHPTTENYGNEALWTGILVSKGKLADSGNESWWAWQGTRSTNDEWKESFQEKKKKERKETATTATTSEDRKTYNGPFSYILLTSSEDKWDIKTTDVPAKRMPKRHIWHHALGNPPGKVKRTIAKIDYAFDFISYGQMSGVWT